MIRVPIHEGRPGGVIAPSSTPLSTSLQTALLLAALVVLAGLIGALLLGLSGLLWGAALVTLLGLGAASVPADLVLRLQGARPLHPWQAPALFGLLDHLSARAGLPTPALYLLPSREANALATGGAEGGALAVTRGLLDLLDREQLAGVLAHELAHLRSGDTALLRAAQVISVALLSLVRVSFWASLVLALFGYVPLLTPLALLGLHLALPPLLAAINAALSRSRELAADELATELTQNPYGLASALVQLSRARQLPWPLRLLGLAPRPSAPPWLRSHPPTRERVERLLARRRHPRLTR